MKQMGATGDKNGTKTHPEKVPKGEAHYLSKLTEKDVLKIRKLYQCGNTSIPKLSKRFGVCWHTVWCILHRETWKHI